MNWPMAVVVLGFICFLGVIFKGWPSCMLRRRNDPPSGLRGDNNNFGELGEP